MTNGDEKDKSKKGLWDWIELLSKFMPAILVAVIALLGNQYLQDKQKADSNLKLYTQLLANKENSENTLRKDMFFEMLKSFLSPEKGGEGGEQTITKIREKLFSLELLARNFHESLDMKPLFKHVLMEIIRPRIKIQMQDRNLRHRIEASELINRLEAVGNDQHAPATIDEIEQAIENIIQHLSTKGPLSKKENELMIMLGTFKQKLKEPGTISSEAITGINHLLLDVYHADELPESFEKHSPRSGQAGPVNENEIININAFLIAKIKNQHRRISRLLSQHNRELDRLISIAKRVTRKQREVLEDVSGRLSLRIPLQGDLSERICQDVKPNERIPEQGKCPNSDSSLAWEMEELAPGVKVDRELFYLDSNGKKDDQSKRYFSIKVRYVYPRWKQVYVQIENSPSKVKHEEWLAAKKDFKKIQKVHRIAFLNQDKEGLKVRLEKLRTKYKIDSTTFSTMIENNFEINFKRFLKNYYGVEESAFWLEYFDFPLVDNSYINSKQRYSVVLEDFNPGWNDEDESVDITLLYYPASYAGLKEKAFYNNQLMNTLMKDGFFKGAN